MTYGFMKNSHIYSPHTKEFSNLDEATKFLIDTCKFTTKDRDGNRIEIELWECDGTQRKDMTFEQLRKVMKVRMGHDGDVWITRTRECGYGVDIIVKYPYVKTRLSDDGNIMVLPFQKVRGTETAEEQNTC